MVAKSPNLLLEIKLNGIKHSTMRSSHMLEMAATKVKKPNTENHKPKVPLPSITKELMTSIWSQQLLTPTGNQWLVPVMSPSEGLVYKPYTGPCPPSSSAFMVPMYGQDSLETAFRFPVSTQLSHNYFPPSNTRTTFDNTNLFGQYQRLYSSTSSHMTQAISFSLKKSQESNDSETHGSTASSPPENHKLEVLPLFPIEPTHQTDDYKQNLMLQAIPHNPTSASDSASRIVRSIQEKGGTHII
ncbi:ELF3-like protein 2 [Cardamine amara subsp. amara]|uniref:ELF3-like protein 2 n=1 Tax=Cardamine amara subsp. amara TaxID=228776 RepID=A0ABD1BQ37_CARAN